MKNLIFSLLLLVFALPTSYSQWEMQMPKPDATNFVDVAVLSPEVAVIVGQRRISRTTDGGETYWPVEVNRSGFFSSVYSTDNPDIVWLATTKGQVLRSTDMGASWDEVKSADEVENSSFYALSEQKAWVSESNGLLLVTSDAGDSWDTIANGLDLGFFKFLFINDTVGFATPYLSNAEREYSNVLLRSVNGGAQWDTIVVHNSDIKLLEAFEGSTVWYAGTHNLYTSYDAGNTWSETILPVQNTGYRSMSLAATSPDEFVLLLHYNFDWDTYSVLYSTKDGGVTWEKEYSSSITGMWPPPFDPVYLNSIDAKYGVNYMVGSYSHILVKNDESGWILKSNNILGEIWDMMFVDKYNGFGVGYGPYLLKTQNGGKSWESDNVLPDSVRNIYKVWFSDLTTGYVLDFEEGLFKTIDGGDTWRNVLSEGDSYFTDLFFVNNNTGWVLKIDGTLYKTNDAGETWSKVTTLEPANHEWITLLFKDEHTGFATYKHNNITQEHGGIVKFTDGSITSNTGIEDYIMVLKLHYSDSETLWAACSSGIIYKSTDDGETWHTIDQILGNGGHPVLDIFFTTPEKGYALCDFYGLYTTEDGGDNWSLDSTKYHSE